VRYRKQARLCCSDASINKALAVVYIGAQHDSHTRARRRLPKGSSYTVSPSRFDSADVESEKIRALHDLVGLRLEVIPGAQLYEWDDKVENNSKLRMAVPCPPHADADADATSGEEDMLIHGELVPTSLRRLVVRAAGTQWHFDPQTGEEPVEIHEEQEEEHQLMHEYRFYIRRNLVRQQLAQSRSMLGEASPKLRASSATWAPGGWWSAHATGAAVSGESRT